MDLGTGKRMSWNDQNCLSIIDGDYMFRYIRKDSVEKVKSLFRSGLIGHLVRDGLLQEGEMSSGKDEHYPLIIIHPIIKRFSYPFEWATECFKDAALVALEAERIANGYGYTMYDPHPFNMVVDKGKPVYLDYGSFVPINDSPLWGGYENAFRDTFLYPLGLYEEKLNYIARRVLREIVGIVLDTHLRSLVQKKFGRSLLDKLVIATTHRNEITSDRLIYRLAIGSMDRILGNKSLKKVLESATHKLYNATPNRGNTLNPSTSRYRFLRRLTHKVESLKVSRGSNQHTGYYESIIGKAPPWERDYGEWTEKEKSLGKIMDKLNPTTVLDVGANTGWYSSMFARGGSMVTSLDRDEESINRLYRNAQSDTPTLLPLVMDISCPTPQYEMRTGTVTAATERLKSDLVMALGMAHHLVAGQGITLEHLAYWLNMFTEKYLLVEFAPRNDEWADLTKLSEDKWNFDVFRNAFSEHSEHIGTWHSYPATRRLLLFERRNDE